MFYILQLYMERNSHGFVACAVGGSEDIFFDRTEQAKNQRSSMILEVRIQIQIS